MKKSRVCLFLSSAALVLSCFTLAGCGSKGGTSSLNAATGAPVVLDQGTWCATSGAELASMMDADHAANADKNVEAKYVYDEHVLSYMMDCDESTFKTMTENNDFQSASALKTQYGSTAVKQLKKNYKIGVIRNDGTSDESVAFEKYLNYISTKFSVSFSFVTTASGDATADTNQIQTWGDTGYDAVVALSNSANYDGLKLADKYGMKYCMFAGHPSTEDEADMIADFPNAYTGSIGPTKNTEGVSGYNLAKHFIDKGMKKFAIFGGAVAYGAELHAYRVAGMFQAMIEADTTGATKYKNKTGIEDIAQQLMSDRTVSLTGLTSTTYQITGYADGFATDDSAWQTALRNAANSGEDAMLCAGASDLVMGMTGLHNLEGTPIKVGGIDSLTEGFQYFFSTGAYEYCDGKFGSMPGPMVAAVLRDLEGNKLAAVK